MEWWNILLIIFATVFTYRLLKNMFRIFRTNYYINTAFNGEYPISEELIPAINRILSDADMYTNETLKHNLFYARGIFKSRIKENFSLFFWVEYFLFLPKRLLHFLGYSKKRQNKAIDAVISAIWWVFCFVVGLFSDEIKNFIISLFSLV